MEILDRSGAKQRSTSWSNSAQHKVSKLEVLSDYSGEDGGRPSLQAWLAGDRDRSLAIIKDEVRETGQMRQERTRAGVLFHRVKVVELPLNDYTEWELAILRVIAPVLCEDIYTLDVQTARSDDNGLVLPLGDLTIIDHQRAMLGHYDQTGRLIARTFYDETDDISSFIAAQALAFSLAKPLQ